MKWITEEDLRAIYNEKPFTSYESEPGVKLTPGARQFLQDRQINVFADGTAMHVGDGVVAGRTPGSGTPDLLKNKQLAAAIKSTDALFLLTACDLMETDPAASQEVMLLGQNFNDIKAMGNEVRVEPISCPVCSGINADNYSTDLGECFDITSFHMQTPKGKQILLLHRLRCALYEFQVTLMETHCTNKAITQRVNQIINRLNQMICNAFGGDGCPRK